MPPTVIVREGEKDILEEVEHKKLSSQVRRAIPSENSCLGDVRIIVEGGKDIYINEKKMEEKAKERDKREKNETNIQEGERITVVKRTKSDIQILPIISNKVINYINKLYIYIYILFRRSANDQCSHMQSSEGVN